VRLRGRPAGGGGGELLDPDSGVDARDHDRHQAGRAGESSTP
jgi:hypothetical protein